MKMGDDDECAKQLLKILLQLVSNVSSGKLNFKFENFKKRKKKHGMENRKFPQRTKTCTSIHLFPHHLFQHTLLTVYFTNDGYVCCYCDSNSLHVTHAFRIPNNRKFVHFIPTPKTQPNCIEGKAEWKN